MKKFRFILLASLFIIQLSAQTWFEDSFKTNDLSGWKSITGDWKIEDGIVKVSTNLYDQLLRTNFATYSNQPYYLEVELKGNRSGVFFGLTDKDSKFLSHMIRFDDNTLLIGYFTPARDFTATSIITVDKKPTEWTKLTVEVLPDKGMYSIYVNDKLVGSDTELLFPAGYIGLEGSDGLSEFRSVKVYGKGNLKRPTLPPAGSDVTFNNLKYLKKSGNNLLVFNSELDIFQMIDSNGKIQEQESLNQKPLLVTEVKVGNKLFKISDKKIFASDENGKALFEIAGKISDPAALLTDGKVLFVSDPGTAKIFMYSLDGELLKTFSGSSIGGLLCPQAIDFFNKDLIALADINKLVFIPRDLNEIEPTKIVSNTGDVIIQWQNSSGGSPRVEITLNEKKWDKVEGTMISKTDINEVVLNNLNPLTRYAYKVYPTFKVIPQSAADYPVFRFATPPVEENMMAYNKLPLLFMVYKTISYRDKYPADKYPNVPDGRTLSDDELEYLKKEATKFNTDFYFRNSSCKVLFDWDFYVIEDTLWLNEVGDSDPYWLSPNERVEHDFEKAAASFNKSPEDYAGVICSYAWKNYPERKSSALRDNSTSDGVNIRQAYGGAAIGVPAPWKYGKTSGYNGNPNPGPHSRQDWLITHEFHHQIDALFAYSGFPEYYHADMPWVMPGRFGEDFDFNAWIIRNIDPNKWLALNFGKLEKTLDSDKDGIPDDDPKLPFDEKRLGSDPSKVDTDGDGLTDLQEFMSGTSSGTSPVKADTDGDGISDFDDPEPLYNIKTDLSKSENESGLAWSRLGGVSNDKFEGTIYVAYTDSDFYVKSITDKPSNLLFQIDADADGWFHGVDNIQIRLNGTGDSVDVVEYYLRDCSSWTAPPKDVKDILKIENLPVKYSNENGKYSIVMKIPASPEYGFELKDGSKIALRAGLQMEDDRWVWNELFERNYMVLIKL